MLITPVMKHLVVLLLQLTEICQLQLQINRLDVCESLHSNEATIHRVDPVADVQNVAVLETADDMENHTHLSNCAQKLVSKALSLVRSLNQSGDVDKLHFVIDRALRVTNLGELIQSRIRHRHDCSLSEPRFMGDQDICLVRVNRAEGIVSHFCELRFRQRIEQR